MSLVIARDSVSPKSIPLDNLAAVLLYADGRWAATAEDWALFPDQEKLSIVVDPSHEGDVLDIENGDATPADAPGWCDRFNRPKRRRPTLYCNEDSWPAVRAAVGAREVDYVIATLEDESDPTKARTVPGAVATQYHDFGGYDESIVTDTSWINLADPAPSPQPLPLPPGGLMGVYTLDQARPLIWLYRLMLFGTAALSELTAQQAIDFYAGRIAAGENPEAVLTAMLTDAQKDPRLDPRFKVAA